MFNEVHSIHGHTLLLITKPSLQATALLQHLKQSLAITGKLHNIQRSLDDISSGSIILLDMMEADKKLIHYWQDTLSRKNNNIKILLLNTPEDYPYRDIENWPHINGVFYSMEDQERVVNEGRDATVMIDTPMGELSFHQWLHEHLLSMRKIAELMDITYGSNDYRTAWQAMMARAQNPDNTPSAQVLADTKRFGSSWQFGKSLAQMHATHLKHQGMLPTKLAHFDSLAQDSLRTQAQIEQDDQQSFADYMRQYRS